MTQKYKLIVLRYSGFALNNIELAQRVAFSYGYDWPEETLKGEVKYHCKGDLFFDPNTKTIQVITCYHKQYPNCVVVDEISGLNDELKNPAYSSITLTSKNGAVTADIFEDYVHFTSKTSKLVGNASVPKELLDRINPPTKYENVDLPTAYFPYNHVYRLVEVTKMDANYIQGFEIERDGIETERSFKKFCRNKVQGEVILETFRPA